MKVAVLKSFVGLIVFIAFISCNGNKGTKMEPVTGKSNEIVIVVGKEIWKGETGALIRKILAQPQSCLPQDEPLFTLKDVPPDAFINLFKSHRNIITVKISSTFTEPKIEYTHDTWAYPQAVINIQASSSDNFEELFSANTERIIGYFLKAERDRLKKAYLDTHQKSVCNTLEKEFGVKLYVPQGFKVVKKDSSFAWIRYDDQQTTQNILVYTYPHKSDSTFTLNYLLKKRNYFTRKNIRGDKPGSYMTTETKIPRELNLLTYKGNDACEMRGLWKMQNDLMGGPFVSLTVLDPDKKRVVTVEGNVYAPKDKNRNYIRQLEAMIYSLEFSYPPKKIKHN